MCKRYGQADQLVYILKISSMINHETIEKILDAANIADVVGEKLDLKKTGSGLIGLCPFHNEKTPSFSVSPAKNIFKCFGCGIAGGPVKFIMEHDKLNYPEALRYLAAKYNIPVEEKQASEEDLKTEKLSEQIHEINEFAANWYTKNLLLPENVKVLDYALSRFSMNQINEFRIGFAPNEGDGLLGQIKDKGFSEESYMGSKLILVGKGKQSDYFRNRLMFPVMDNSGRVIGFGGRVLPSGSPGQVTDVKPKEKEIKYLYSPETLLYDKSAVLYGLHNARKAISLDKKAYLVKGYTDLLRLCSLDVHNVIAPYGTVLTTEQVNILKRQTEQVVMIYDGDPAGRTAMIQIGELLLKGGFEVYVVLLPDEKDPGNYFTAENIGELDEPVSYVLWRASLELKKDGDPESHFKGLNVITKLLELIPDENLQKLYVSRISKIHDITQREFKDLLKQSRAKKDKKTMDDLLPKGVDLKKYNKWGFYQYKNQYYFSDRYGIPVRQTNFVMKPLFHTMSSDDSRRIYEIINLHGHKIVCDFDMNQMTSLPRFRKNVEEKGNFLFLGNDTHMTKLKLKLYEETTTCYEIKILGWQKEGFWAWSNGIQTNDGFRQVDEQGIVEFNGENYYIPAFSSIHIHDRSLFTDERKFKFLARDITSFEWSEKLVRVFGENAKVAIAFWVAAVFRDHILNRFKNFPIFNLFGPKGTGKSQLAISLTAMFGESQTPFNIHNGTKPGLADHLQQFINGIAFIDEYKNSIDFDKIEILKSIYDSVGRSRMNLDKRKKETTAINQAVVICGQDMMTGDIALLSRTVFLQYTKASFGADEKAAYDQFKGMESLGFSHLTAQLLEHREYFESNFYPFYEKTFADYNERLAGENVEDRIIRSMCSIVAAFRVMETKMKFSFDYENLLGFTTKSLRFHNKQLSTSDDVGKFWDILESMFDEDRIIDKWHFRLDYSDRIKFTKGEKRFDEAKYFLKIKFNVIAKLYSEQARSIGIKHLDSETLRFYLENHKAFIGYYTRTRFYKKDYDRAEAKVIEHKQVTSAMIFLYEDLGINLERQGIGALDKA